MGLLKLDNMTHWSIPVNNLEEAEQFYQDILGLEYQGRWCTGHIMFNLFWRCKHDASA